MSNSIIGGSIPPVYSKAQWMWDVSALPDGPAIETKFPSPTGMSETKTGLLPADLQNFIGIPLVIYGNPPIPISAERQLQWIRWAEDWIEQETGLLLCQTWIASPPAYTPTECQAIGIIPQNTNLGYQIQGLDYDLEDAGYDFKFNRAQDEGWMIQSLRYKPLRQLNPTAVSPTAVQKIAYIYPLLTEFFSVPRQWIVEDHDYATVRLVPAANVAMLPLFAMQLAFMGFAESVPGALWFQYLAGLTPNDYRTRFSMVKQLVLARAAGQALRTIQLSRNFGAAKSSTTIDGVQYVQEYDKAGPYSGGIKSFKMMEDELLETVRSKVSPPMVEILG